MGIDSGKQSSAEPGRKAGITVLADDDIRRDLEQRALRNSRALVDSLEDEEQKDRGLQRKATWAFAILLVGFLAIFLATFIKEETGKPVEFPKPGFQSQTAPK